MSDMYDKLGDLLNEALETGIIETESKFNSSAQAENIQDRDTSSENCDKSGLFSFRTTLNIKNKSKNKKRVIRIPKISDRSVNNGEIIKMYKYTENMHISPEVQKALATLDIVYPYTWIKIKHKYRLLLKQAHPDIKNTIQNPDNVQKSRPLSIDEIKESYEILRKFFGK